MSRELVFDGYWEGDAEYTCDCCGKTVKFRFDSEDSALNAKGHRKALRVKRGWITTKLDGNWFDFCGEPCMVGYIKSH